MLRKLEALYIGDQDSVDDAPCLSGALDVTPRATTKHQRRNCVACRVDVPFFDTLRCPCSHDYCRECIASLFEASMSDETLFPPRCCGQTIPLGMNQIFLPSRLVGQYRAKELEYNTPNRTYCHSPECSTFIPPPFIHDEIATCIRCERRTCVSCKNAWHTDECPDDARTLEILEIAGENGWQRCFSCRSMVELNTGCNHISTY